MEQVLNRYSDGGAIQLYGHATDVIFGHNEAERTTGFWAWGQWRGQPSTDDTSRTSLGSSLSTGGSFGVGMNPTTRVQMLSNIVLEGNNVVNVWYTNTTGSLPGQPPQGNPGPWLHGTGIANFMDQNCFGVIDGRVGYLTEADTPTEQWANAFTILRNNVVRSNGGIWIGGKSRDVLVEHASIQNSAPNMMSVRVDNSTDAVLVV